MGKTTQETLTYDETALEFLFGELVWEYALYGVMSMSAGNVDFQLAVLEALVGDLQIALVVDLQGGSDAT